MIQSVKDKLIHKIIAEKISPIIDKLLSRSAYAYRKGIRRKKAVIDIRNSFYKGYDCGIKADISTFFDSVKIDMLESILKGLIPFDPIVELTLKLIKGATSEFGKGIPQGSPLSPSLSNLYLDSFDREMIRNGYRFFRYCDDFILLTNDSMDINKLLNYVEEMLEKYGLTLNENKIEIITGDKDITFLGFTISNGKIVKNEKNRSIYKSGEWSNSTVKGNNEDISVYLTWGSGSVYSDGKNLIMKRSEKKKESIDWNRIKRVLVIGRATFSKGVIYRCIREEVPVTFFDITGRTKSHLLPYRHSYSWISQKQKDKSKDKDFCLSFAKEAVSTKINNYFVLLRRSGTKVDKLKELSRKIYELQGFDSIRGVEGTAARIYFSHFANLVQPFEFTERVYHPPKGEVNSLLSFGYTLLYNRIASIIRENGLDPRIGFFHINRGRHYALASDLMEPMRHIIDRLVLALIHRKEIKKDDFYERKMYGTKVHYLKNKAFKKVISKYEKTLASTFTYNKKKISYNNYIDRMVEDFVRSIKLNIKFKMLRIR